MSTEPVSLDRLRIATPCPIGWEQMTGDNRVRFCELCKLNVYNISELTRTEVESLIASSEGRICAKLYRRADGTVLTKDCPVGLRALRLRVSKRVAAMFAAIMSLSGATFAQQKDDKTSCTPQVRITRTTKTAQTAESVLSGTLLDPAGAVVAGAKVTVITGDAKDARKFTTNDAGRFEFPVTAGTYSLMFESPGFKILQINQIIVEKDQVVDIHALIELSDTTTIGVLAFDLDLPTKPPGTTIITEQMIRMFPIP